MALRQDTVSSPAEVAWRVDRLRRRVQAMGLLANEDDVVVLEPADVDSAARRVLEALNEAGIARAVLQRAKTSPSPPSQFARRLDEVWEAVEDSPVPQSEIKELVDLFDWAPLSRYVGASTQSLRRYAGRQRVAPDPVAQQVHWLTGVVADLRAAYNEAGIRRWFERPRPSFEGHSPAHYLSKDWTPDDPNVGRIRDFAARLAGPTDAT